VEEHAGVGQQVGEEWHFPLITCPLVTACVSHQEHPFFTLHKTKKTDIAAFVKEILGEDS
jgi:hypothetical protein